MADQAVDTDGAELSQRARRPSAADGPFLGRTRELKELLADIERAGLDTLSGRKAPRARVLLIAGRPGLGRTALARELVRQVGHRYGDGVLRTRLSEPDGTPVPTERTARELLDALGLPVPAGAPPDELGQAVREALSGRRALLLLDDAVSAEQVDALLPDTPDCLVVAVSEGPLTGISDVRPCTLGGLDTKSALDLLTRFTGAVRVTVDPRAAEGLVEECAGQPAALVLAGGWLAARPEAAVADLARHLRSAGEEGPPTARLFQLAYEGLPALTQRLLRLLSLAPAGLVDAHTASALAGCSPRDAAALLDGLAAQSFLRRADPPGTGPSRTDAPGPEDRARDEARTSDRPRYEVPGCLLPLLRDRARSQDRPAELQLARARMLERTVRLLQSCRAITETDSPQAREKLAALPGTLRFSGPRAAEDWLRTRQPALLAAARLAVADGELDTLARRLMAALVRALVAHFGTEAAAPELYLVHGLVRDVAERRDLPREEAAALLNLADLDARTGRTAQALRRYRDALDAGRRGNDPYATGRAMESVGAAHQELRDHDRAADWYGRALAQRLARDEHADAARLYGRLATVQSRAGRHDEALRNGRAAVAVHRRAGDVAAHARALSELARLQEHAGRPADSMRTCHEAIEYARRAEDTRLQVALRLRVADTLERLGDPAAARLQRGVAERMLGEGPEGGPDGADRALEQEQEIDSCEIRSTSDED
ncbi:tetratricopeptide repeat protein [Streptomyces sp. NPDC048664]|uniref:tetratricopeptide repeat protein n=1 Tax=Streptomyces sp. NPDC048664 TaxID=3154505 RepID=UPI00344393A5